jgi:hypothetical protein
MTPSSRIPERPRLAIVLFAIPHGAEQTPELRRLGLVGQQPLCSSNNQSSLECVKREKNDGSQKNEGWLRPLKIKLLKKQTQKHLCLT